MDKQATHTLEVEWIVLSKAPVVGLVKTRLISVLGEQGACDVYCQLLHRLERTLSNFIANHGGHVALWVAGDCEHEAFQSWIRFSTLYQQPAQDASAGADLGQRMALAVQSALARGRLPVLIGVDVPSLDESYLMNCLRQLQHHDLVISPAEDGGYGLLGMKQFYPELFLTKDWGTHTVFSDTHLDIENLNIRAAYLPMVWDVDEAKDVQRFQLLK